MDLLRMETVVYLAQHIVVPNILQFPLISSMLKWTRQTNKKLESTTPQMRESMDTQVDKGNTDNDALSVEIGTAVYSVVNKPSPPQIPGIRN